MVEVDMESLARYRSDLEQGPASLLGSCSSSQRVWSFLKPREKGQVHPEADPLWESLHGAAQPGLVALCRGDHVPLVSPTMEK